jgi:hypothetical protein
MSSLRRRCAAKLRDGRTCRRSPVPGRRTCIMHGGSPTRQCGPRPRRPDAKKAGRKPRDPAVTLRRKAHAKLLSTDPSLAVTVPRFATAALSAPPPAAPPVESSEAPPWPPDGYHGGDQARRLEKAERDFIRDLDKPVDLEAKLLQATDYTRPSYRTAEALLTNLVQAAQQYVEERLAVFAEAEATFRCDGAEACQARLERLRFESDAYIRRLADAKLMLVLRLEDRERRDFEHAHAMSEAAISHLRDRAELRSAAPRQEERPSSIAPWLRR